MQGLPYPLSSWAIVDESFSILSGHENWKMYNGLEFDEDIMKNIAEQKARHAELFLSASRRPRRLLVKCVSDVSESRRRLSASNWTKHALRGLYNVGKS